MVTEKREITPKELEKHLDEQLRFLESSVESYDRGFIGEAKRIATIIRVLLHDAKNSRSLLSQLNKKTISFLDTTLDGLSNNIGSYGGLVALAIPEGDNKPQYMALLDEIPPSSRHKWVNFETWWEEIIFINQKNEKITRRKIILTACNQDGGVHIDPKLDVIYDSLVSGNFMGWEFHSPNGKAFISGAESAAIRQIAHEILKTLKPGYSKKPEMKNVTILTNLLASKDKINKSLYIDIDNPIPGYFERKIIRPPEETIKVIEGDKPDSAEAHNNLGISYAQKKEIDKAIEEFKLAIKYKPNLAEAHNNLGAQTIETDKAINEFRLALKYKPDFAEAHNNLGIAYAKTGEPNMAIEEYGLAIKFKVDYEWAYYNLGVTYIQTGETDKAIAQFKLALKYKPDFAWAHYNLGVIYKKQGGIDKAIEEYKSAIKCEPDFAEAHNSLGVTYGQAEETGKAIEEFKLAIKYKPDYVEAHNNLRIAYKKQGERN
ncbi:MAG: tetratricopeptide repeat protein [Candidatus Omnitrophica bacterium]|nr:tetratricopeptide repeat protein [Candidatus Omnitrophota bacterium]